MDYTKYILTIGLLIAVATIYEKYKIRSEEDEEMRQYELVRQYLVTDSSLAKSKLPILWIYVDYKVNARKWISFFSRNTIDLNQPYMYLTIKSIIDQCGSSFNICIIDDDSFTNIIPGWNIDMSRIADPIKDKVKDLAMARLLKHYGGLIIPPTFMCEKNLDSIYYGQNGTCSGKPVIGEIVNHNVSSTTNDFMVTKQILGAQKNNDIIEKYINYLERLISQDYTAESVFLGSQDQFLQNEAVKGNISVIPAKMLGAQDTDNKPVRLANLLSNSYLDLTPDRLGIYIPGDEILKRTSYQWFAYLSAQEAIASDTFIGKQLLCKCGRSF